MQLFDENGVIERCFLLKREFNVEFNLHLRYMQLFHAIPNSWKRNIHSSEFQHRHINC